jgi:spore coat-associated protein N
MITDVSPRRRRRGMSLSTKLIASIAVLGVAAAVAGLGTYATFTSSTSATHTVSSGNVSIALGAVGPANRLTVNATALAAGDTVQRAFDLSNSGSIDLSAFTFSTSASPSSALDTDTTSGLQMVIDKCSVAWTESGPPYTYTCSGTTSSVVASRPVIGTNVSMSNVSDLLTSGTTDHLLLTLTLPSAAPNSLESLSSTITYTFTGTQRAATNK